MTTNPPNPCRSGRRQRILLLAVVVALALFVLLAGSVVLGRRTIARRVLESQLRAIGAEGVEFRLKQLGPGESRLTDVKLPDDAARVARIEASYSLPKLARFQIQQVAAGGIEIPVRREAQGWRIPLLEWINQLRLPPANPDQPPSFVVTLPNAQADAVVRLVHYRLGEWRLPVHVSAAIAPDQITLSGSLEVLGNTQSLSATLDPELTGEVHCTGRLADLSALHTLGRFADLPLPVELVPSDTEAQMTGTIVLAKGKPTSATVELALQGARLRWRGTEFAAGAMQISLRSTSPGLTDWQLEGTISGLGGYGVAVTEVHLTADGNEREGTFRLDPAEFRQGELAGTLACDVAWRNQRVTGTITLPRLQYGDRVAEGIQLKVSGDRQTIGYSLRWQDEAARYGLRSVNLAGQALLAGDPQVTVAGQTVLAIDSLASCLGLAGWNGEGTLQVLPGTSVRLGNEGLAWQARLAVACSDLAGTVADLAFTGNDLQVDVTGSGTATTASLTAKAGLTAGSATQGSLRLQAKMARGEIQAIRLGQAELQALLAQPFGPLPSTSPAKLNATFSCESLATNLAPLATTLGKPGLATGRLEARLAAAAIAWTPAGPQFAVELSASCPDLVLTPPGDLRLELPAGIRAKASGDLHHATAEATVQGSIATIQLGTAEALLSGWQAALSSHRISLAGLEQLAAEWSLPEGEDADISLVLGKASFPLAAWGKRLGLPVTDGEVDVAKTEIGLHLGPHGIDTTLALAGQGRELVVTVADQTQQAEQADFEVQAQGNPTSLSGALTLSLAGIQGKWQGMAGSATHARLSLAGEQLDLATVRELAADPFGFRQEDSPAKASLSVGVEGGQVALDTKQTVGGITLATGTVLWTAREGWQSTSPGLHLGIAKLAMHGILAEDVTADATLAGADMQFALAAPLIGPGVTAEVAGEGRLAPRPSFKATVKVPEFSLSTDQGWVLGLADFGGTEFAGKVSAQASARWNPRRLSLGVEVGLKDGKVVLPNHAGQVQGIEAALALDLLPTLRSRPRQSIRFASASAGQVVCGPGEIQFRLDGPRLLFVEQAEIGWCGGKLNAYALRFDADQSDIEATVYARGIDVAQFVSVFPNMNATGEGRLYGRLPAYRKKGRFGYDDGFLYSIPGEHGRLQMHELGVLAPALKGMGDAGVIVGDALTDLDYSLFRADIHPSNQTDAGVRFTLAGTKAGQTDAQPIQLDVNVGGTLEEALNLGIKIGGMKQIFTNLETLQRLLGRLVE